MHLPLSPASAFELASDSELEPPLELGVQVVLEALLLLRLTWSSRVVSGRTALEGSSAGKWAVKSPPATGSSGMLCLADRSESLHAFYKDVRRVEYSLPLR